jgi:NAD(P)-dependent dehydrogenase (short-subunit alcohol dehydrogenase family)
VSLSRLVSDLKDKPIDLLINNAGIHGPRGVTADKIELNDWIAVMRTNAMSPLFVARALRQNIAKSEMKTIANISSQMGSITNWAGGSEYIYKSSKAALNMTMACFADEVAADGIKVVIYHPGWVRTDMGGPSATLSPTQSVVSMRASIASLTMADSGTFLNYDGASMPW